MNAAMLQVTCWGTRGSIPAPGPMTARYGGNTPCVEVRAADDRCLIFDAGTGIRALGQRLARAGGTIDADLFFTHFHWDHVQGIPFFAPLYDPDATIRIHGAKQDDVDVQRLFAGQLAPIYFPVPYEALAARLSFSHLEDGGVWRDGGLEVAALRVRHPATTLAYRVRAGDAAFAYIPDDELVGGSYAVDADWHDRLLRFLDGVDLLFHDAMYTEAEYRTRSGWGHSTFEQAVRLARDAGVRRVRFFHHAPDRTDAELTGILAGLRERGAGADGAVEIGIATEGEELAVGARAVSGSGA